MASQAQITANRENAKKSTGPKTAEGKARSSQNALKHGYNSAELVIPEDLREEFLEYQSNFHTEVSAVDEMAFDLTKQLIHAGWNQQRIELRQLELFSDPAVLADPDRQRELQLLIRYHSHFNRVYNRTMKQLRVHVTEDTARTVGFPGGRGTQFSPLVRAGKVQEAFTTAKRLFPDIVAANERLARQQLEAANRRATLERIDKMTPEEQEAWINRPSKDPYADLAAIREMCGSR